MNDETRETLWAYLDGALPEGERRALEARLAASESLRAELESLRAVSRAVRNAHPESPVPDGFLVRLRARRDRGDAPRRDWVFLPHELRPAAAALSIGVIALTIWDRVAVPPPPEDVFPAGAANVALPASAPVSQLNVSGRVTRGGRAGAGTADLGMGAPAAERQYQDESLPLVPAPAEAERKELAARSGRAPGAPLDPEARARARGTMTEQERSARNEALIGDLERQKKAMGIVRAMSPEERLVERARVLSRGPQAPAVAASAPALLEAKGAPASAAIPEPPAAAAPSAEGRPAPEAGLVFSDARSLAASWVVLGLPGRAPAADFARERLVVLKPSATKILSVSAGPDAVTVVFRALRPDETPAPARDRAAAIPLAPQPVVILDATPR